MYDTVEINLNQKVPSADLTRIGQLARAGLTAETRHMLAEGLGFADFAFDYKVNGFSLTVSDGFLYKNGAQHKTAAPTPVDLVNVTPPTDGLKRIVSIVAYALPAAPAAPEQREFAVLVTPATNAAPAVYQTETRQGTTLNRQVAGVATVVGDIAPQPTAPITSSDQCELARIVLTRAGIESVTVQEQNRAPNLRRVAKRVDDVEDFVNGQGVRIDTLDKNLAALAAKQPIPTSEATLRQMTANLAILNETSRAKVGDLAYGSDVGLDQRYTDNTVAGFAAFVGDGIRMPWTAAKEVVLSLFTPNDSNAKIVQNLLLPDFTEEARVTVTGKDGSLSISNQVNTVTTLVKVEIPRSSVSYGPAFTLCNNSAFWQSGTYNAATQIFSRAGENFVAQPTGLDWGVQVGYAAGTHIEMRLQEQWVDTWTETRWDQVTTIVGVNGTFRGQTFKVPDFGYLTSIDLPFTTKDEAQGVTLILCETTNGSPYVKRVLETCDLTADKITADANGNIRTKFSFRPVQVDPSKLYAWVTVTKGNYALATVKGNKFAEGTSFNSTDNGEFFAGDLDVDFAFTANFARFKAPRVEFRMNDLDNANGDVISALKFLYGSYIPSGCQIVHMARRSGGDWLPIATVTKERTPPAEIGAGPFDTMPLPVSVQHKIVLIGTTTLMPAIDLSQAWATALKIGTAMNHFTPVLQLGTPCNRTEVQLTVDGPFDPAKHTVGCNLIVNGSVVAPTIVGAPRIDPNKPGKRIITYSFSHALVSQLRINVTGSLATMLDTFHVDNRFFRSWAV